jgi:hypothetical protein
MSVGRKRGGRKEVRDNDVGREEERRERRSEMMERQRCR